VARRGVAATLCAPAHAGQGWGFGGGVESLGSLVLLRVGGGGGRGGGIRALAAAACPCPNPLPQAGEGVGSALPGGGARKPSHGFPGHGSSPVPAMAVVALRRNVGRAPRRVSV